MARFGAVDYALWAATGFLAAVLLAPRKPLPTEYECDFRVLNLPFEDWWVDGELRPELVAGISSRMNELASEPQDWTSMELAEEALVSLTQSSRCSFTALYHQAVDAGSSKMQTQLEQIVRLADEALGT